MKPRRYKVLELLTFDPIVLMLTYYRAIEGYRYRLLATY
jgi:hypothetical protein